MESAIAEGFGPIILPQGAPRVAGPRKEAVACQGGASILSLQRDFIRSHLFRSLALQMSEERPPQSRNPRQQIVAMLPKNGVGMEIGVWKGDFSAQLLQGLQPRILYLVDPWIMRDDPTHRRTWYGVERRPDMEGVYHEVLERFAAEREGGTVVVKRGLSDDVLREFPDRHFDFIYIDGDHEYTAVRKDCFLAFEKVRPGGLICGDDYSLRGWWGDGVVRAFHELIADKPVKIKYVRGSQIVLERLR